MRLKNFFKILKVSAYVLTLSMTLTFAACTDTIGAYSDGDETTEEAFTLRIPLSFSEAGISTRALEFPEEGADVNVQNVWIGVYNKTTGIRLGASTRTLDYIYSASHKTYIELQFKSSILFDVQNPEVYIVGVANYSDIKDRNGEELKTKLGEAETWSDYLKISVDAASAEQSKYALMSGMFSWQSTGTSSSHFNNTVNYEGIPKYYYETTVTLTNENKSVALTPPKDKDYQNGAIHLRRLYSQMNVNIECADNIELSDVSWQVFNMPKAVFLQERTTEKIDNNTTAEDWQKKTPNVADIMDLETSNSGGYENSVEFTEETTNFHHNGIYDTHWESGKSAIIKGKTDNGNETYSFNFWHYENKHWGLEEECEGYDDREKSTKNSDGTVVYTSLCPEGTEYNNNASYFVINAYVKDGNTGLEGKVQYLIHEGYVNDDTGASVTEEKEKTEEEKEKVRVLDFSCFRNTIYTYTIKINGLNNIVLNATSEEGVPEKPGISGMINENGQGIMVTTHEYDANSNPEKIYLSDEQCASLQWRIYEPAEDGSSAPTDFGSWEVGSIISCNNGQWKDTKDYSQYSDEKYKENEFLNEIKISGSDNKEYSLIEFIANAQNSNNAKTRADANGNETKEYTIKLPVNNSTYKGVPANGAKYLYLYTPIGYSANNSTCNNPLYGFAQQPKDNREKLKAPSVTVVTSNFKYGLTTLEMSWTDSNNESDVAYYTIYAGNKVLATNVTEKTYTLPLYYAYITTGADTLSVVAHPQTDDYLPSEKGNNSISVSSKTTKWTFNSNWSGYDKGSEYVKDLLTVGKNFGTTPGTYFQTGGSSVMDSATGLPTTRFFKFTIPAKTITTGKITVEASNNGSSTAEYKSVAVKVGTDDAAIYDAGYQAATALTHSFDISDQTDADVDVYIYTTTTDPTNAINGNLRIYSITYSPN